MKIGIITLSASYNCGSLLQGYALKKILEKYGETEIINFTSEKSEKLYSIVPDSIYGKIRVLCRRRNLLEELKTEKRAYIDFQKNALELSDEKYYADDLYEISEQYDLIVAGSDQIWNVSMGDFDVSFFAGWTSKRKVAYAPSLGGHDIRDSVNARRYIELIKEFSDVSVREEQGKKCLETILGKNILKVADPTLLYGSEQWKKLIGKPYVEGDFIFFYSWSYGCDELRKIVSERSRITGNPVYVIDAHKWRIHSYKRDGFALCDQAGPLAFLNLMYYAKECFVESFHGMMFAYIFKKNFWLLDNYENSEHMDSRLKELVMLFDVGNRVLTKFNIKKTDMEQQIEYRNNPNLNELLKISNDYLERVITDQ